MAGRFVKKTVPVTTGNITDGIVNQILSDGGSASRINVTGIIRNGNWTRSGSRKGFADIAACVKGRGVVIEVKNKYTNDSMRKAQSEFRIEWESAGGIYYKAETIELFNEWYFTILPTLIHG